MTAGALSPNAYLRKKRRVLRRLAEPEAFAREIAPGAFGLFVARNRFSRPVLTFDGAFAAQLASDGLTSGPPRMVLLEEGRAFLMRTEAGEDGFSAQHRAMGARAIGDARGRLVTHAVNLRESPLAWLASRKGSDGRALITPVQFEAGERLRSDYTGGQLQARVTVDWQMPFCDGGGGGDRLSLTEAAMAARKRVSEALAVVGPGLGDILVEVCCHLKGLEEAERAFHWPPRTGKVVLRIALERLAAHYGLIRTNARSSPIKSWSAESA